MEVTKLPPKLKAAKLSNNAIAPKNTAVISRLASVDSVAVLALLLRVVRVEAVRLVLLVYLFAAISQALYQITSINGSEHIICSNPFMLNMARLLSRFRLR